MSVVIKPLNKIIILAIYIKVSLHPQRKHLGNVTSHGPFLDGCKLGLFTLGL